MNKIIVRKSSIKDLNDVIRLNLDLFKKEYKEFDKSLDMKWPHSRNGKSYFSLRASGNDGFCVVAENNKKIIGYLCGGLRGCGYREKANYAELENMLVDKKFRGKGVGTMLANEFLAWCKDNKVKYISVTASAQNTPTIEFYRKLGFRDYGLTLELVNQ